ncbi:MAG TPA: response regulator transcription factor [Candidatus Pullichristensenella excrementigallinarum]|uniref:Stage 0 sporulation protein A homolog n=1 Tax=Candidatus Pullichristensenella excrementigallinarum TaxID=2840907 RepID=A0A9D1LDK5_9FIRM|nr:response regulator transcription factor [Candidatus Pullichristensenella excrementigallinarum]
MKSKILLVDDDPNIRQLINLYLEKEGYEVIMADRGDEALKLFRSTPPNLILLDIMLPGMDGWQVCREVRKISNIPIIMLTAKDETFDKVLGLELGADDYMVKPIDMKELVARIKAVIRRYQVTDEPSKELVFPGLTINISQYTVSYMGKELEMPPREIELLYFLASHPGMVFTREQLLEQVWGYDFFGDSRTVDVHVKRLREKLTGSESLGWQIKTVWGVGYKFEVK